MVTALWALDDFTAANGATLVAAGSHRQAHGRPARSGALPVEMPAGSVLLFVGRLWYGAGAGAGAGASASTRQRRAVVIDYAQPWLRPREAHTLSAGPRQVRQLPQRLQRLQELLGFSQPSPYLGFVNGKHPRERLMSSHHDGGR